MTTASGTSIALVQLSALVGTVLPLVAAILKQDRYNQRANSLIAIAVAVSAAVITTAARGELTVENLAGSFTAVYTVATAFYHGLWNPTGVAPTVQTKTPLVRKRPELQSEPEPELQTIVETAGGSSG